MQVSFREIIKDSFQWMVTVLFKTFNLKKWIAFTFIAIIAGYLSFNSNFNIPNNKTDNNALQTCPSAGIIFQSLGLAEAEESEEVISLGMEQEPIEDMTEAKGLERFFDEPADYIVVGIVGVILMIIMVLFIWLNSRFKFIFIEDIVKNDGSIKLPWANNAYIGNQLFLFNLFFTIAYLSILGLIAFRGYVSWENTLGAFDVHGSVSKVIISIIPHILLFIISTLVAAFIYFFVDNLVTPIMFKLKQAFMPSWVLASNLFKKNLGNFVAYYFITIGLGLGAAFATMLIAMVYLIAVVILGALLVVLGAGILSIIPLGLKVGVSFALGIFAVLIIMCAQFIMNMLLLPIPVFFRTLGLKFIAVLDKSYDVFK